MRKRILALLMIVVMFFITGCGANFSKTKVEMEYGCKNDEFMYGLLTDEGFENMDYAEAPEEITEQFNKLCQEEVEYINEKYDLNFKVEEIPVYLINLNSVDTPAANNGTVDLCAVYVHNMNAMIVNPEVLGNNDTIDDFLFGVLAHEAGHYIYAYNNGTPLFVLKDEKGGSLGNEITEGMNQKIVLQFLKDKGYDKAYDEIAETYRSNVYITMMLECSIKNLDKIYLNNDMETLANEMNRLVENYTTAEGDIKPIEHFLYQTTIMMYTESLLNFSMQEEVIYAFWRYSVADLEMIFAMARESSEEDKEILWLLYEGFCDDVFYGGLDESVEEQLEKLLNGK